jgi:PEP-CTERM motif
MHAPFHLRSGLSLLATAVLGLTHLSAHALIEAGHWSLSQYPTTTNGDNFSVRVDQTPAGDFTGTFFDYDAATGTLTYIMQNVDEGSAVWVTQPGEVIDASFKPNTSASVWVGQDFYLGAATSSMSDPGFTWGGPRTSFGWAHFTADSAGKLTLVDSAMAFREPAGIIVGTLTSPVPEPSAWALMGIGLVGLGWMRRQKA